MARPFQVKFWERVRQGISMRRVSSACFPVRRDICSFNIFVVSRKNSPPNFIRSLHCLMGSGQSVLSSAWAIMRSQGDGATLRSTYRRECSYYQTPTWILTSFLSILVLILVLGGSSVFYSVILPTIAVDNFVVSCLQGIVFTYLLANSLISYFRCMFTEPGAVPADSSGIVTYERKDGIQRVCPHCKHVKPDRAHHCRTCGVCVLKMDHHCPSSYSLFSVIYVPVSSHIVSGPWVNNCVGHHNYKYFNLFTLYTGLLCLWNTISSIPIFILYFLVPSFCSIHFSHSLKPLDGNMIAIIATNFISVAFGLTLSLFSGMHWKLLLSNQTTLESFNHDASNAYDLGKRANFHQVFGQSPILWMLPIYTSFGTGLTYLRNDQALLSVTTDSTGKNYPDTSEGDVYGRLTPYQDLTPTNSTGKNASDGESDEISSDNARSEPIDLERDFY